MLPKWHFFYGLVFSLLLFQLLDWYVVVFLAATVLIDFDHYLIYIVKRNNLALKKVYIFFKKLEKRQQNPNFKGKYLFFLSIFHTYEFILIIFLFTFFNRFASLILLGLLFHLSLDIISTKISYSNKFFIYYLKALSLIYHISSKYKKSFGELKI
jgi:hypothetical protein